MNGYLADSDNSNNSTFINNNNSIINGISPSLGGSRFKVNMLKEKYKNKNKGTTNIYIDYSTVVG